MRFESAPPLSLFRLLRVCAVAAALLATAGCAGRAAERPAPGPAAQAFVAKGAAAYARMDFPRAWEDYRRAEALGVRDGIVSYRLDALRQVLKKKPLKPKEAAVRREETLRLLEAELRGGGASPSVYFYLAQARDPEGRNPGERAKLYAEALNKFETGAFKRVDAEDLEKLARMNAELGQPGRAERLFLKAIEQAPHDAFAAYGLGKLYRQEGRNAEAVRQFERLVKIAPRDPEGHVLLGESAFAVGDYARARDSFEAALALDSNDAVARDGLRRAKEALRRQSALKRETRDLVWRVGFRTRLRPLTAGDDDLRLSSEELGPPDVGPDGRVVFAADGGAHHFEVYAVSLDGVRLVRRAASTSGFVSVGPGAGEVVVAVDFGPRREVGVYDAARSRYRSIYRGDCLQPDYDAADRALLCAGRGGVVLVDGASGRTSTIYREPSARQPRFSPGGESVVLSDGDRVVWLDRSGNEKGRVRVPGGQRAASFPAMSPDGRWIISGEKGLRLISVAQRRSVALDHPGLKEAGRAAFGPEGRSVVFVRGGRLFRMALPGDLEGFFAFQRAQGLIREGRFAEAVRLLKTRPARERGRAAYHMLLGRALMGAGLRKEALKAFRQAASADPQGWEPPLLLGRLYAAQGKGQAALDQLNLAVERSPGRYEGYLARAGLRFAEARYGEAIGDYRTALARLGPEASGAEWEETVLGLLGAYVKQRRMNDALLLLIDDADRLSAASLARVQKAEAYAPLRRDPRFREVMGLPALPAREEGRTSRAGERARAAGPPVPYEAKVFIDGNPNPVDSVVLSEDGDMVTIRAFGVVQRYPKDRLRIVR